MDLSLETVVSVALGLGLAAAAGFRVFVPLLVLNLASRFGYVPLAFAVNTVTTGAEDL